MEWRALVGSLPHALSASQYDQVGQYPGSLQSSRTESGNGELPYYGGAHSDDNNGTKQKQSAKVCPDGKEKVRNFFLWAGKRSLEIYMIHGLLLNIFKSDVVVQFSSIEGYLLTAGNFALTVGLCAVVIRLLDQNAVLKKVLNIR